MLALHPIESRIISLRRLMLVHCCAYYSLDHPVISDAHWQHLAWELADLQDDAGEVWGFYDPLFAGWDGSSGYHLYYDADVQRVAKRIVDADI